jgi:hypothetical protein
MKDSANTRYLEYIHIPTRRSHISPFLLQNSGSHQNFHLFFPTLIQKRQWRQLKTLVWFNKAYAHLGTVHWRGHFTFIVISDSKQNHSQDVFRKLRMPVTQLWFTYLVPEIFNKLSAVSTALPYNKACTINLYSKRQETYALSMRKQVIIDLLTRWT